MVVVDGWERGCLPSPSKRVQVVVDSAERGCLPSPIKRALMVKATAEEEVWLPHTIDKTIIKTKPMMEDLQEQEEAPPTLIEVDTEERPKEQAEGKNTHRVKLETKVQLANSYTESHTRKVTRDIDKRGETKRPFK